MTPRVLLSTFFSGVFAALPAAAFSPDLPVGAVETAEVTTGPDSYLAPTAAFDGTEVPAIDLEGTVARRAWRIARGGLTTLELIQPLRTQLSDAGYEIIFECDTLACGGFDFRFQTEVLPGPNMNVNLSRFRYLTALRGARDAPREVVTALASATTASAYIQIIHVTTEATAASQTDGTGVDTQNPPTSQRAASGAVTTVDGVIARLEERGSVILDDLEFDSGSTELSGARYRSLEVLAQAMSTHPDWRIALVGHTDAVGGLEANIALSRARAGSVRARLINDHEIDAARLDAEGMGYLSPVAPNLSPDGRAQNRRVEAVLLAVE